MLPGRSSGTTSPRCSRELPNAPPRGRVAFSAGQPSGAAFGFLNEGLNHGFGCTACLVQSTLKGAVVGGLAAVPFALLPAAAGVAAFAAAGAGSGAISYTAAWALDGADPSKWSWAGFAASTALGGVLGALGGKISGGPGTGPVTARVGPQVARAGGPALASEVVVVPAVSGGMLGAGVGAGTGAATMMMASSGGGGGSSDGSDRSGEGSTAEPSKNTSEATKDHVHRGGVETDPQSPYNGKWDGKGVHDWDGLQAVCDRDGYTIKGVTEDPVSGARRVEVERVGTDPRTGAEVRGTIKKTLYPREMTPEDIDAAGDRALRDALRGEPNTKIESYGTKQRVDGTPADGYFEATVPKPDGRPIRVQGWFREATDGAKTISSHAPQFDKNWPVVPPTDW